MRLRTMSARVEDTNFTITIPSTGEIRGLKNAKMLVSYNTRVALWCDGSLYLLPSYDYSVTTMKHVRAFVEDYTTLPFRTITDLRLVAPDIDNDRVWYSERY